MKNKKENIYEKIAKKFKSLPKKTRDKYNELTKVGKKLVWLWGIILTIIVILIIVCANNNVNVESHTKVEKKFSEAALKYAEDKELYGSKDQKTLITMEELIDSKYLKKSDITDNTCSGYALFYNIEDNDKGIVDSYLKCKKYTTEGYKNQ